MKIVSFSVKNYQFTIIVFLLALALGINSLLNMPRGEDPQFKAPNFSIIAVYPGTSPRDVEKLVTKPIEDKINELNDIKRIRSDISDGLSVTRVEFTYGVKIDDKYNEVVREVNSIRADLPELQSLEIQKFEASDVNTYQLALLSDKATYKQLYDKADELKTDLEKIRSIKKIKILAYPEQQVRIAVDLQKLAQNNIPISRLMTVVKGQSTNIPGGSIDEGGKKFNIKTTGDYASLTDIGNTVIAASGERIVFLKDIATVDLSHEDETYLARYNGKRGLFIAITEKENTNIISDNKIIEPVIAQFSKTLPANMQLEQGFVQAQDVDKRLSHFFRDFMIAIFLVAITLIPLGWRASAVVMISIPLSISIGLFLLNLFGYTINQLTIVGLVVSLGLLVDDSIVVIENIERYLRKGYSPYKAAIEATNQIGVAIIGCTAILIVSFLPIVFLPEGAGDFIRSLPMAVITTVLASLFVSITVVPFLSSLILSKHENPEGNVVLRKLQSGINHIYRPVLHQALKHPYLTVGFAALLFTGSLLLFKVIGFSLFPKSEKPMFLVNIETPLGTNLYKTDSIARYAETVVKQNAKVNAVFTNVGKGNPPIYYNAAPRNEASNYAQLFVRLQDMELPEMVSIIEGLRSKFNNFPNARIEVKQFEQGPPVEAPVAIRVFGDNLDSLRGLSAQVENILKSTNGTIYVNNPLQTYSSDIKIQVNKNKAALLGVQTTEIDRTVRMGISGLNIATYKDEKGESHNINISLSRPAHQTQDVFNKLYVSSDNGTQIPLNQLTTLEYETSVPLIKHYNKNRYVLVTSYVQNDFNTGAVTDQVIEKLDQIKFPAGYSYAAAGEVESSQESFGGLGTIILITVFGFLGILLLEFKTFKSMLIVLSVIPLGVVGAVGILLITGNTLSFVAIIGIIALAGIEVKNSILLVDYTNQLRAGGMGIDEAIEEAGETRFLPIILTSLTAIMGMIPLVLEHSPFYSPLAWVLIGGLISSTILTRLVTPVVYKLIHPDVVLNAEEPVPSASINQFQIKKANRIIKERSI
ncbi:MAG: efflux RND transporter permease subunit [Chitinophagaceae bacterium]